MQSRQNTQALKERIKVTIMNREIVAHTPQKVARDISSRNSRDVSKDMPPQNSNGSKRIISSRQVDLHEPRSAALIENSNKTVTELTLKVPEPFIVRRVVSSEDWESTRGC